MNFPRCIWNENIKCDLLEFLKTANANKTNEYCNKEEYIRLKTFFPLSNEMKKDIQLYTEKSNICIDITNSSDEECHNYQTSIRDYKKSLREIKNINSLPFFDQHKNVCDDLVVAIKDSLNTRKEVSRSLLEDLQNLDNTNLEKCFLNFAEEFTLEDIENLWKCLSTNNISNDFVIKSYMHFLLLPKVKQEFSYEILQVFLELSEKESMTLKSELINEFNQTNQVDDETPNVLVQYVNSLANGYKAHVLRDFIGTVDKLNAYYIPFMEALLSSQADVDVITKLIEIMANAASEFCSDNAYGKLLFKVVNSFDRHSPGLEQPLKRILGTHKSIWKIKVEKIVFSWFNDSLTQSFL